MSTTTSTSTPAPAATPAPAPPRRTYVDCKADMDGSGYVFYSCACPYCGERVLDYVSCPGGGVEGSTDVYRHEQTCTEPSKKSEPKD